MGIATAVRDFKRISYIANVLVKNGLGHFVHEFNLKYHLPFSKKFKKYNKPDSPEVRLRKVMEQLGGAYIKLGQLLSLRPDLVPEEYCKEFSKLQDSVRPFAYPQVKAIVEKELKKPLSKVFAYFEKVPTGSASIGQVHAAKLLNGKKVVVKVQRPDVDKQFFADIDIMYYFAHKLEKTKKFKRYSPMKIVEEFDRYTRNELNYVLEGRNIEKFYANFKKSKTIVIPRAYREYSTAKILTMDYLEGTKLVDLLRLKKKFNRKKIASDLLDCLLKQIFIDEVFHADLHPGNIIIMKNGKIGLLDFGIVGSFSPKLKASNLKLFTAILEKDVDKATRALLSIYTSEKVVDVDEIKEGVDDIIGRWYGAELQQVKTTHMLHELFDLCTKKGLHPPVDVILFGKGLVTVEGTGIQLTPEFDVAKVAKPMIEKMLKRKFKPSLKKTIMSAKAMAGTLKNIPESTLDALDQIKKASFKIDIDDIDVRKIGLDIDTSSNRLSYAMISAAFIVAGAVIMHANIGPALWGYSMFALACFGFSLFLLGLLGVSISREGKL